MGGESQGVLWTDAQRHAGTNQGIEYREDVRGTCLKGEDEVKYGKVKQSCESNEIKSRT